MARTAGWRACVAIRYYIRQFSKVTVVSVDWMVLFMVCSMRMYVIMYIRANCAAVLCMYYITYIHIYIVCTYVRAW